MEKRGIKEWIFRSLILVIGLVIAHLGVTLFLLSNLGADPFNVFVQGLFRIISSVIPSDLITHGRTHMAVCLIIIFILLFVDKSYIKIGTVICMVCGGPIIDFFTWLLGLFLAGEQPLWGRILMLVSGCVILAYGMTIVIKSDAGTGPNDLVAVVISDKTKKKFGIIRLVVDGVFAAIGFLLGGVLGAGTIVCIALVGPVAGVFLPINERMINKLLKKEWKLEKMGDFFDSRTEGYEEHQLNTIDFAKEFYPFTAVCLPKENGARILDLGCGTGLELDEFFAMNPSAKVTGIDLAAGMLNELKKKFSGKDINLILGSYFEVPFGEDQFDASVSVESLHHFTKEEKIPLYKKLKAALKNGGYFILTDYFAMTDEEETERRQELIRLRKEQNLPDGEFYHYDTPLTVEHEKEALLAAGFSTVEVLREWGSGTTVTLRAIK